MSTGSSRTTSVGGVITLLGALLATSLVAGLLGAGLFMPAVGAAGATARAGVHAFDSLPAELKQTPAGPAVPDPRRRRQRHRHVLRREPHRRPARQDRAGHADRDRRDRGRPLLQARRRRPQRPRPGRSSTTPGRRHPGRLDPDPAVRQADPRRELPGRQRLCSAQGRDRPRAARAATPASCRS